MYITTSSVNPVDEYTLSVFEIDGSLLYLFTTDVNYYLIVGNYYQSGVSSTQDLSLQCRIIKLMFFVCPYIHFRVPHKRAPSTSGHWCLLCIPAMDSLYFMFIWLTQLLIPKFCIVKKGNDFKSTQLLFSSRYIITPPPFLLLLIWHTCVHKCWMTGVYNHMPLEIKTMHYSKFDLYLPFWFICRYYSVIYFYH